MKAGGTVTEGGAARPMGSSESLLVKGLSSVTGDPGIVRGLHEAQAAHSNVRCVAIVN